MFDAWASSMTVCWKLTPFIDVYKVDDKIVTSGVTSRTDLNLWETRRAIDSVATGSIPSLLYIEMQALLRYAT